MPRKKDVPTRCPHAESGKCSFFDLAQRLDRPAVTGMLERYCGDPEQAKTCVHFLVMKYYQVDLPSDVLPDGNHFLDTL